MTTSSTFQGVERRGFGLVEAIVGVAIISVSLITLISVSERLARISANTQEKFRAAYLLQEGMEAARFLRDSGWNTISGLTQGQTYYISYTSGAWQATTTPSLFFGTHARTFVVSSVERNGAGAVVASGGTVDADTKRLTFSVSWQDHGATTTVQAVTHVSKIF